MFKVLIVEDDPMVAMINEQYVSKNKQFSVAGSVRNGQDAIDFLKENKVDLIVLDVFMPYMDGIETLKKIREMKISAEAIMVTAANDAQTLEQTMHLGVIDYLIKPFAYDRFQVALEKFSAKIRNFDTNEILDQSKIDSILSSSPKISQTEKKYPKGIQQKTLELVENYFTNFTSWQRGDEIAEHLGLSNVTVRHYLNYLADERKIEQSIDYETGGRPSVLYRWIKKN